MMMIVKKLQESFNNYELLIIMVFYTPWTFLSFIHLLFVESSLSFTHTTTYDPWEKDEQRNLTYSDLMIYAFLSQWQKFLKNHWKAFFKMKTKQKPKREEVRREWKSMPEDYLVDIPRERRIASLTIDITIRKSSCSKQWIKLVVLHIDHHWPPWSFKDDEDISVSYKRI